MLRSRRSTPSSPATPFTLSITPSIIRAACVVTLLGALYAAPTARPPSAATAQAPASVIHLPVALEGRFGPAPVPIVRPSATPTSGDITPPPSETAPPGTPPPSETAPPGTPPPSASPPPGTPPPTEEPAPTPARRSRPGRVSGSVYALLEPGERIAVPDIAVRLVSLDDFSTLATTSTDLYGAYHFPPQPAGTYGLCWEAAGFPGECVEPPVTVADADVTIQPFRVNPEPGVIFGRVTLRDGEACHLFDPARDLHVWTVVELQESDGTPIGDAIRANAIGEYVLAGVPIDGSFRIQARCEAGVAEARLIDPSDTPRRIDITFLNARPVLDGIEATIDGLGVRVAAPSAEVEARAIARDANGDALSYEWYVTDGTGTVVSTEGPLARWSLPESEGVHALHVVVADGRGGFARGTLRLEVRDGGGARFAGRIVDGESGKALEGAVVRVNRLGGAAERSTDGGGRFELEASGAAEEERLLYVHRPGYSPIVTAVGGEARGATLALFPLEHQAFDPARAVTLVDRRPSVIRSRHPGARVELPANSLVGVTDGVRAAAIVTGTTTGPIIGGGDGGGGTGFPDYSARQGRSLGLDREGTPVHLDSYGTVSIAFFDTEEKAYAPRPGTSLGFSVPISPTTAISAPTTAPIWFLDGETGMWWNTFGRADLVETPDGPMYVGSATVPDAPASLVEQIYQIALPDGFGLTCVRVAPDVTVRPGTTLRAEVRYGSTLIAAYQQPIVIGQTLYPFLQIQKASSLRLMLHDTKGQRIATATKNVPLATRPAIPGEGAANVPAPYSACGTPIPLTIPLPADVAVDGSGEPVFLTGMGFPDYSGMGISYADVTDAYYAAVDPLNQRTTLSKWWQLNGFGVKGAAPGGTGELVAAYLNHNDLGFGREMHCLRTGPKVACWVTNYGAPDFGPDTGYSYPSNADLAAGKLGPGPTVTMEFTDVPAQPGRRFVTFYAYGGGTGSAPRVGSVDLDGSYPKPIPQVCAVCHGGRYDPVGPVPTAPDPLSPTVDDLDFGASFREWDLPSLRYTLGRADTQLTPTELQTFRGLNERVRDYTAPSAAIVELLDGWYGPAGSPKAGPGPDLAFVPPGFVGPYQESLYTEVIAPSCRTCHIARGPGQDFNAYAGELDIRRGVIEYLVCGQGKYMPNARLTFNNFWWSTDPHRPASLAAWDDGSVWTPAIGVCD